MPAPCLSPGAACAYCGDTREEALIHCDCGRWFCNSHMKQLTDEEIATKVPLTLKKVTSHILMHWNLSACNSGAPCGSGCKIKCEKCPNTNIFELGFVERSFDHKRMIVCRDVCRFTLDSMFDANKWVPILRDRLLNPNIIADPVTNVPLDLWAIQALERAWAKGKTCSVEELKAEEKESRPSQKIPTQFDNCTEYAAHFSTLMRIEQKQQSQREHMFEENIDIEWLESNQVRLGLASKLVIGDVVELIQPDWPYDGQTWVCLGMVVFKRNRWYDVQLVPHETFIVNGPYNFGAIDKLIDSESNMIEVTQEKPETTEGYIVNACWSQAANQRVAMSLRSFSSEMPCMTQEVKRAILGNPAAPPTGRSPVFTVPNQISVPGLNPLNEPQNAAVRRAIAGPLTLIQGPPGTGKTVTAASIVYMMLKSSPYSKVLVCAPSNAATDHLAKTIKATGVDVVRLCARSREFISTGVDEICVHNIARLNRGLPALCVKKLSVVDVSDRVGKYAQDRFKVKTKMRNISATALGSERTAIHQAQVVCCTCSAAGDSRLNGVNFQNVLIDECAQAIEPDCLIPICKGAERVVLVGDHKQLGPLVLSKKCAHLGLERSMFERLVQSGIKPSVLTIQYRMHPELRIFPGETFYDGVLVDGVSRSARDPHRASQVDSKSIVPFAWPDASIPMVFYDSKMEEEFARSGDTYLNREEADNVVRSVLQLMKAGIAPSQIGVITFYSGQRENIMNNLHRTLMRILPIDVALSRLLEVCRAPTTKRQTSSSTAASDSEDLVSYVLNNLVVDSVDAFQGQEKNFIILSCTRSNRAYDLGFLADMRRLNVAITRAKYGLIICGNSKVLSGHRLMMSGSEASPGRSAWSALLSRLRENDLIVYHH